jgi:RND family efflux transporter MFP subunit
MHGKFSIALAVLVALAGLSGLTSCRSSGIASEAHAAATPSARVAMAQRGDIDHVLTLAGQFQPYQVVDVHPKVSGYMKKINVDIGDIVRQGQTLAILEVPELKAQLQESVFRLKQSQEEVVRAQHEVKSAEALNSALHAESERLQQAAATRPGLIAQQELDDAQAKDLNSQAQIDAAKAALAAALQHSEAARANNERVQALQDYTTVTAPIAGVVIWRYADTGALIQGGTNSNDSTLPIVRLSQSGLLRLRVPVPEDDIKYVSVGDVLQVRVDAINRSFTGKITRFTRNVNFETRTMETEVDVDNKDLSISPGMYANAALQLSSAHNAVTIPVEALVLNSNQQETVYILDSGNRVHIRNVTVGIQGSKLAEITSGLEPGDRVIIGGQEKYQEGEDVNPLVSSSPASETMRVSGGMIDMKSEEKPGDSN